jgi:hypothetical protein
LFFFLFGILTSLVSFLAQAMNSLLPLQLYSLFDPSLALSFYYLSLRPGGHSLWAPSFSETLLLMGAGYAIIASILFLSYFYFSRRLSV